jgi:hypothetical protein
MRIAFKEWAVVVDALAQGTQIVILRKGGIHEGRGGFKPEHRTFLLFPTLFHQQRESVIETAKARFDLISENFPSTGAVRISHFAEVIEWRQIVEAKDLRLLRGQHIWKDEVLQERFTWGREQSIWALAVRVFMLAQPAEIPLLPEYGGCKSWVELAHDFPEAKAEPVLSEEDFQRSLTALRSALPVQGEAPVIPRC